MSDVKLSDQLGAMAIIDELHQQHILLMEHLDQSALRQKIAQRIKDYYQSIGSQVDDVIVEEGVRLWFDKRLRFELPRSSWFQRFLARCYITRRYWLSVLAVLILSLAILFGGVSYFNSQKQAALQNSIHSQSVQINDKIKQIVYFKQQYLELSSQKVNYTLPAIERIQTELSQLFDDIDLSAFEKLAKEINVVSQDQGQQKEMLLQQNNSILQNRIVAIADYFSQWQMLIKQDFRLHRLANDRYFISACKQYAVLQQAFNQVRESLAMGNVTVDIDNVESLYREALKANDLKKVVNTTIDHLQAMRIPANEMLMIFALRDAVDDDLSQLNTKGANQYVEQLIYSINLANTPLTLKIVDRVGEKSGVERTYDNSGGKAWYLVVEATTAANKVFPIMVKNNETGRMKMVNVFAVRVSEQEYNKVRRDKLDDGHIDHPIVGNKPAGRLTFDYVRPVMDGMITEW